MNTTNTQDPIKLLDALEHAAMGYAQDRSEHTERRLNAARSAVIVALQPAAAQPQGDAREAFEAWHEREYGNKPMRWSQTTEANNLPEAYRNRYIINDVEKAWKAWQAATAQASEPSANIHANSETLPGECWKNPLFPLEARLQMADGAVAFERKVNANLRARLDAAPARAVEPLTITEDEAWNLAKFVYAHSNPHDSPQILLSAMEIKQIIERAHGITTPAAKAGKGGADHG